MTKLGVAVIGCGFQGRIHAENVVASPNAELVACIDVEADRAASLADDLGAARWATSLDGVWTDSDIGAVVIASTTNTHLALALAAAHHRKHMLLEKPMALTVDECLQIEQAAAVADVRLMLGYKFRFTAPATTAKEQVPDPRIITAHTIYDPGLPGVTSWVNQRSLSGGRLVSSLVHAVDMLRFLSGAEIRRVSAEGAALVETSDGEADTTVASLAFDNGAVGSIVHGTAAASGVVSTWSFQSVGVGVNATIHDHGRRLTLHRSDSATTDTVVVDPTTDPFRAGTRPLLEAFLSSVVTGEPASPDGHDGMVSLLVSRCIEEAMVTGHAVEVPEP